MKYFFSFSENTLHSFTETFDEQLRLLLDPHYQSKTSIVAVGGSGNIHGSPSEKEKEPVPAAPKGNVARRVSEYSIGVTSSSLASKKEPLFLSDAKLRSTSLGQNLGKTKVREVIFACSMALVKLKRSFPSQDSYNPNTNTIPGPRKSELKRGRFVDKNKEPATRHGKGQQHSPQPPREQQQQPNNREENESGSNRNSVVGGGSSASVSRNGSLKRHDSLSKKEKQTANKSRKQQQQEKENLSNNNNSGGGGGFIVVKRGGGGAGVILPGPTTAKLLKTLANQRRIRRRHTVGGTKDFGDYEDSVHDADAEEEEDSGVVHIVDDDFPDRADAAEAVWARGRRRQQQRRFMRQQRRLTAASKGCGGGSGNNSCSSPDLSEGEVDTRRLSLPDSVMVETALRLPSLLESQV